MVGVGHTLRTSLFAQRFVREARLVTRSPAAKGDARASCTTCASCECVRLLYKICITHMEEHMCTFKYTHGRTHVHI